MRTCLTPIAGIDVVIEDMGAPFPPGLRLETTAGGITLRCPAEPLREVGKMSLLAVVKDVAGTVQASVRLLAGERILAAAEFETGPVPRFEYHLMPSSHLCFGYFTGLPEHWEAFRSLRDAVQLISEDDHYTYNVEFLYGLKNLLHKRPQLLDRVKRFIREGRLDISPTLAPSYADFYEGESYIRQFAESQWWLRRRLGVAGPRPLLLRQSRVRPADASDPGQVRDLLLLARALRGDLSSPLGQPVARCRRRGRHPPSQLRSAGRGPGRVHHADHLRPLADRRTDRGKFRLPEQGGAPDGGLHSRGPGRPGALPTRVTPRPGTRPNPGGP